MGTAVPIEQVQRVTGEILALATFDEVRVLVPCSRIVRFPSVITKHVNRVRAFAQSVEGKQRGEEGKVSISRAISQIKSDDMFGRSVIF